MRCYLLSMKNILVAVILSYLFLQGIDAAAEVSVLRLEDRKTISFDEMMEELRKTDVIFVGELHDHMEHHMFQLGIIKSLHSSKVPVAVGLEMFMARDQSLLDSWVKGALRPEDFIKAYGRYWGVPWHLYSDIFYFLRDNKIPAIGLNVPDDIVAKVNRSGFSSLSSGELEGLPRGITCKVDRIYMDFMKRAHGAHGNSKSFVNFCEAQLLRDKAMARHIADHLKRVDGRLLVVLAGSVHAWKEGVPQQLKELLKGVRYKVILPEVEGSIGREALGAKDADYILLDGRK